VSGPTLDLSSVAALPVDGTTKGFPALDREIRLDEVAAMGWSLTDLEPPLVTLRDSAIDHNLSLMAAYCRDVGVELAPHGKTTMAPQLWARQLDAGSWGLTAATAEQARIMRSVGVDRILIANEVVDPVALDWVARTAADQDVDLLCYVDSVEGVDALRAALDRAGGAPGPGVLVELGHDGGRGGCRTVDEAAGVAAEARRAGLALAGVSAYEGTVATDRSEESLRAVRGFVRDVHGLAERLIGDGAFSSDRIVVSAGGSVFFDLVAEGLSDLSADDRVAVVLRSGCYLTHDSGIYERNSPFAGRGPADRFHTAIEAWGSVLSRPEPRLSIVGVGRRDVPFDQGLPRPLEIRRDGERFEPDGTLEVTGLQDQHAFLAGDGGALRVGDLVRFGISHPCTAFDRWRVIPVLDDDDLVIGAVATFF
jgi:D-serine dehydratase